MDGRSSRDRKSVDEGGGAEAGEKKGNATSDGTALIAAAIDCGWEAYVMEIAFVPVPRVQWQRGNGELMRLCVAWIYY